MEYRYRDASEMKDSGVEWIGKIPKYWEINKLKNISSIYGRIGFRGYTVNDLVSEGEGAITLSPSNIEEQKLKLDKLTYISWEKYEESPEIKVYNEDIVFVKTASVGKVAYIEGLLEKATINPQFVVFKNIKMNKKLLYYILVSNVIQEQINSGINGGVVNTLTQQDINNYYIPYQNNIEQEKIANFLDKKTLQFDSIISKKEALIEKLEEAKKSLISEVVTGKVKVVKTDDGYELVKRSSEEMKDSGVEWIGCIPKGFKIVRLGLISFVTKLAGFEYTNNMAEALSNEGEVPIVRAGNIKMNKFINQEKEFIDIETSKLLNRSALYQKCVLITFIGAGIGEVALFDKVERHHLAPNVAKIEILGENKNKIDEQYLIYYLMSSAGQEEVNKIKKASAQPSLSMETIRNMKIVIPELDEQYEIKEYLARRIKEIEHIIDKTKIQIEKLKEAKQSIISEAVTGKIEIID